MFFGKRVKVAQHISEDKTIYTTSGGQPPEAQSAISELRWRLTDETMMLLPHKPTR